MEVADKKREQIIDGAIKRFMHFGINKTTMNDIADDLSVSKPSLYYYFPDKKHLILGVIERIFTSYFDLLIKDYDENENLETVLHHTVELRNRFFEKYFMLRLADGIPDILNDELISEKVMSLKQKEKDYFTDIFTNSQNKKEINTENIQDIAELYIESLTGLSSVSMMHADKGLIPKKTTLKQISNKQKTLTSIFVKGLQA